MKTLSKEFAIESTSEFDVMTLDVQEHSTVTIRTLCDRGGDLKTKYVFDSGKVALDQTVPVGVAALSGGVYSNLETSVFDYKVGKILITFDPTDANPGFVEVEVTTARK
mgnify:FL=1